MIILCICLSSILEAKPITDASPLLCGRIQTYNSISVTGSNNVDGQNIHEVVRHDMQLYHGENIYYADTARNQPLRWAPAQDKQMHYLAETVSTYS